MEEFWTGFYDFISTNQTPKQNKIAVSLFSVSIFSSTIFFLSWFIFWLRKIDILKLQAYNLKNSFFWIGGAVLLQFLLISTKIISYNIVSFLAVAMIWDNLYQKIFNQTNDKDLLNTPNIES